jgi:mRNA interferase MazF
MTERDVLLTQLPQSDGRIKNRPVVVLRVMPPFDDLLVCGVSTQLHQLVHGFDEIIRSSDSDFFQSGLKSSSLIRLGFLTVLPIRSFLGKIGSISPDRHQRLLIRLSDFIRP